MKGHLTSPVGVSIETLREEDLDCTIDWPAQCLADATPDETGGLTLSKPVRGRMRASVAGVDVLVRGAFETSIRLSCNRCLGEFDNELAHTFEIGLCPKEDARPEERELSTEEMDKSYLKGDRIDLGHIVREQIYLSFPLKPLCRDDCKGLCQRCGTDLNVDECTCTLEPLRGPFEALSALKGKD